MSIQLFDVTNMAYTKYTKEHLLKLVTCLKKTRNNIYAKGFSRQQDARCYIARVNIGLDYLINAALCPNDTYMIY